MLDVRPVPDVVIGQPGRAAGEVRPGMPTVPWGWPDTAVDAAALGRLEVRAASCRGLSHRWSGTPRQDAYSFAAPEDGARMVVTVCDGLGSLTHSDEAARIACWRMPEVLTDPIDWAAAFGSTSETIAGSARQWPMATTVLCGVFTLEPDNRVRLRLGAIGDSSAWLLRQDRWTRLLPAAVGTDEPVEVRTAALPAARIAFVAVDQELLPGDAVFLVSDGIGTPLGTGTGEVATALAERWAAPPAPLQFAAEVGFARRGFDDDRTAVGVWVVPVPEDDDALHGR